MRFGENFHSHTVPEWDHLYIDYNRLKQLIKAALVKDDASVSANNVQNSVVDALSRLQSSENALYLSLIQRHDLLFSHLAIQPGPAPAAEPLSRTFDLDVLLYTQVVTFDLQRNLQKIQWFERVNHEAVDRIFTKLRKSNSHNGAMLEWRQMQEAVDKNRLKAHRLVQDAIKSCRASEESATSPSVAATEIHPSYRLDSALMEAITHDSPDALKGYLDKNQGLQPDFHRYLFKRLAVRHSWQCLTMLASRFASSLDHHCLAVFFYSLRVPSPQEPPTVSLSQSLADNVESVSRVVFELLRNEHITITQILCQADAEGHSPLHYAMKSGFDIFTPIRSIFGERKCHDLLLDSILSEDKQGLTFLHFATIEGRNSVVVSFLDILPVDLKRSRSQKVNAVATDCLNIAMRLGNGILVERLSEWVDTTYISAHQQSALHMAARAGLCDYMMVLIKAHTSENLNLNIADSCGRTPLMDAGARGHISMVELLLKAGADPSLVDNSGWTARKYAAHRGHLAVAALLPTSVNPSEINLMDSKTMPSANPPLGSALDIADRDPAKHTLVIYLGGMQLTDNRIPVRLVGASDEIPSGQSVPKVHHLEFSVNQRNKQSQTINLPFLEDRSSKPIVFQLDAETEPQLLIRLFNDDITDKSRPSLLAAGAFFLDGTRYQFGNWHDSLIREHTIILLSPDSQETIGTVLLTYVTARPFGYLQTPIPMSSPASHETGQMTMVGHRGFGMNVTDRSHLQLGENTIGSLATAADHGATFVEFDAQVSRDLKTVIYHDFSLSETGTDIPIHELTIDQYKYASSIQTPHGSPLIAPNERTIIGKSAAVRRSRSFDGQKDIGALLIRDRLKHTLNFKLNSMKPNIRGDVIQESLVTLPELFRKLPPSLGFNIEIKYPRRHEARDAGVAPIALEINLFVDTVLEQIHRFADQRPIILSSFTPEVCILLSIKQKAYPVLFITNAGKLPAIDLERRVASVQAGVHFAKTWGLNGLCLASEPLVLCPELIGDIKRAGLLCASYGSQNSIPENVLIQRDAGLDLLVVDKVALIEKTLKESARN